MTSVSANSIPAAYRECRRLARRHYENFPVASLLVPRDRRDALAAIYAFARWADDVADEPGVERRLEGLARWRQRLAVCYEGKADHPVFVALGDSVRKFSLSREHFENLLHAFESDVRVNRHRDFSSLLCYCTYSANPVGRLVLELFGHRDSELFLLSDKICTALQLANFWQDVRVDLERDRVYLPLEDLERFDYSLNDLRAHRTGERWQKLMKHQVARTQELFVQGKPLLERVRPELRRQLRLTWLGGTKILSRIEAAGYDVFHHRPALTSADFFRLYLRARAPLDTRVEAAGSRLSSPFRGPARRRRLTNAKLTNFYYSFVFLPREKREAIEAVYAFARRGDDLTDGHLVRAEATEEINRYRNALDACYSEYPRNTRAELDRFGVRDLGALAETVRRFKIPKKYFEDLILGFEMDLQTDGKRVCYETFDDLAVYCYRVAGTIGLIAIEIFGYRNPQVRDYALNLGTALQLVNILRDLESDARRGRIYLPREDLERFGVTPQDIAEGRFTESLARLMTFECDRARQYFELARRNLPREDRRSMMAAEIMAAIYWRILGRIAERGFNVFGERVRLSRPLKFWTALSVFLGAEWQK